MTPIRFAFKVGDLVEWTSQAKGCTRTKLGRVVAVIPEHERPTGIKGCGDARDHKSYIVSVAPKNGSKAKPKAYWPVVSLLTPVEVAP
jgi:hypothetical protein